MLPCCALLCYAFVGERPTSAAVGAELCELASEPASDDAPDSLGDAPPTTHAVPKDANADAHSPRRSIADAAAGSGDASDASYCACVVAGW